MKERKKTKEEIIKSLDEQIKNKKILPKNLEKDINNNVFRNILLAIVIMLYFYFICLGYMNITPQSYLTDLKVFSVGLMVTTIVIFEKAYKKDSGKLTIHGIEILILSIVTLFAIHLYVGIPSKYVYIYTLISYIFAIYYIIKSILIYKKKKKEYKLSSAKEITNKSNKIEPLESKNEIEPQNIIEKPKKKEQTRNKKQTEPKKKKEKTNKIKQEKTSKETKPKNIKEIKKDTSTIKKNKPKHEMEKHKKAKGKRMKEEGKK